MLRLHHYDGVSVSVSSALLPHKENNVPRLPPADTVALVHVEHQTTGLGCLAVSTAEVSLLVSSLVFVPGQLRAEGPGAETAGVAQLSSVLLQVELQQSD